MKIPVAFLMLLTLALWGIGCAPSDKHLPKSKHIDTLKTKTDIAALLDTFNSKAAQADFEGYFNCFAEESVFMGTDATEHWNKAAFMQWAKPFFDQKSTWNFKAVQRHIYLDAQGDMAWFDEILDTQMKLCRGSGVVMRSGSSWKIKQYVLSMCIPNTLSKEVTNMKTPEEDSVLQKIIERNP